MNRRELDAFVAHHALSREAVEAALTIADARPSAIAIRKFVIRLLQLAGVLSLAAGVVFFIAANWQAFGVAGHFALVQITLLGGVALALWKPPSRLIGRSALLMTFITTGALLALFGQTYQTGADVYELFLTWAVLGLPFVVAGQWAVICAAWLVVLNVALLLYFGWKPQGGWLWVLFGAWDVHPSLLLLAPTAVNLGFWSFVEYLRRTRWRAFAPQWIARLTLACTFGFATWAGVDAITESSLHRQDAIALLVVLALDSAIAAYAMRHRSDVFPLALIAANGIVISTCALGEHSGLEEIGLMFALALWLVVSSTVIGRVLMSLVRAWRNEAATA